MSTTVAEIVYIIHTGGMPMISRDNHDAAWTNVLEESLTLLGLPPDPTAFDPADGHYTRGTEDAVRQFQQHYGLVADGVAGPRTWAAIGHALATWYPDQALMNWPDPQPESHPAEQHPAAGGPTAEQLVSLCLKQEGDQYIYGAKPRQNDPDPKVFDCSGLIRWACYQLGVHIPDGSSNQWEFVQQHKLTRDATKAGHIAGALLHRPGHVAISLGTGNETIEAKGKKYGVCRDHIHGRFHEAGLIPGIVYPAGS